MRLVIRPHGKACGGAKKQKRLWFILEMAHIDASASHRRAPPRRPPTREESLLGRKRTAVLKRSSESQGLRLTPHEWKKKIPLIVRAAHAQFVVWGDYRNVKPKRGHSRHFRVDFYPSLVFILI